MALMSSAATTEESTPPDSASSTFLSPHLRPDGGNLFVDERLRQFGRSDAGHIVRSFVHIHGYRSFAFFPRRVRRPSCTCIQYRRKQRAGQAILPKLQTAFCRPRHRMQARRPPLSCKRTREGGVRGGSFELDTARSFLSRFVYRI